MNKSATRSSAEIRQDIGHPIVDVDGHMLEVIKGAEPFLREHLSATEFQRFREQGSAILHTRNNNSAEQRAASRAPQNAWWGTHTVNVQDRATASLPGLMYERMDEMGIDISLLYPTNTLGTTRIEDGSVRRGLCAGYNEFFQDVYRPFRDRLKPAGIIPTNTPDEAIAEIEHCYSIGLQAIVLPEGVLRPLQRAADRDTSPWLFPGQDHWFDMYGLDSAYDYDPVWRRATELGFPITFHGGLTGKPGACDFPSNYVANHVGLFQSLMYPLVKSLFFGGVPHRLPSSSFVFLECGVSWAVQMVLDIMEHWEKRNLEAIQAFNPDRLDRERLADLMERHGGRLLELLGSDAQGYVENLPIHGVEPHDRDEFRMLGGVTSPLELLDIFQRGFYFGCEADDRGVATAVSNILPSGRQLKPVFSSDIGHWDVTDVTDVVSSSFELVEEGLLSEKQYQDFVFGNPFEFLTKTNADFFAGTPVEGIVPDQDPQVVTRPSQHA